MCQIFNCALRLEVVARIAVWRGSAALGGASWGVEFAVVADRVALRDHPAPLLSGLVLGGVAGHWRGGAFGGQRLRGHECRVGSGGRDAIPDGNHQPLCGSLPRWVREFRSHWQRDVGLRRRDSTTLSLHRPLLPLRPGRRTAAAAAGELLGDGRAGARVRDTRAALARDSSRRADRSRRPRRGSAASAVGRSTFGGVVGRWDGFREHGLRAHGQVLGPVLQAYSALRHPQCCPIRPG
mmetsp:Transcript_27273/g.87981  ORF Transcript_27273/g.87981 Transcript_27273/m.87981 type:complete len:238 (-) Transcript_27273:413-1126(-)